MKLVYVASFFLFVLTGNPIVAEDDVEMDIRDLLDPGAESSLSALRKKFTDTTRQNEEGDNSIELERDNSSELSRNREITNYMVEGDIFPTLDVVESISGNKRSCWSYLGRTGGRQHISIGNGCQYHGIIMHEIGHALGMWHEQARAKRDKYLNVNFDNIVADQVHNFQLHSIDTLVAEVENEIPFDYGSVMHYGPWGFTKSYKEDLKVLTAKDPLYDTTFGQRETVSFTDVLAINKVYCKDRCHTSIQCEHGGYPDPSNCYQCKCPSGFKGYRCESLEESNWGCATMNDPKADSYVKTFSSGIPNGEIECFWKITAGPGQRVRVTVKSVSLLGIWWGPCKDYIEVKDGSNDFQTAGPRFCGDDPRGEIIESVGEEMIVIQKILRENYNWYQYPRFKGFIIEYVAVGPSGAGSGNRGVGSRIRGTGSGNRGAASGNQGRGSWNQGAGSGNPGRGSGCKDRYDGCSGIANARRKCQNDKEYMKFYCEAFCGFCH